MTEETKRALIKAWIKARYCHWKHFCHEHHRAFHRAEQIGNLIIMGSIVGGVHEIEIYASGYVAVVLVVMITIADDVA
jgi:hypothetical protein